MHRGWMKNPVFRSCEERVLWVTIIERAAWKDTSTTVNGCIVSVPRGSFICSMRTISDVQVWDAKRVSRFLNRLKKCHMIDTETVQGLTQITVCNYEKYNQQPHTSDTDSVQAVTHKERINNKKENIIHGWDEFHAVYPKGKHDNGNPRRWPKSGRDSAMNVFKATSKNTSVELLIKAAGNYAQVKSDGLYVLNPKKFLSQDYWKDFLEVKKKIDNWNYQ